MDKGQSVSDLSTLGQALVIRPLSLNCNSEVQLFVI